MIKLTLDNKQIWVKFYNIEAMQHIPPIKTSFYVENNVPRTELSLSNGRSIVVEQTPEEIVALAKEAERLENEEYDRARDEYDAKRQAKREAAAQAAKDLAGEAY